MPRKPKNLRKDKRYCVRLDIGTDSSGKHIRKTFYSYESKDDAEAKKIEWIRAHEAPVIKKTTFGEWADKWLDIYCAGNAYNTKKQKEHCINVLKSMTIGDELLSELELSELKPLHIQQILNAREGMSKSTIRITKQVLKNILVTACDNGFMDETPYKNIREPKGGYTGHRALEKWEIGIITENWSEHRAGVWAMLMLYAGLRRGELIALATSDIDLDNRIIHVNKSVYFEGNSPVCKSTKTEAGNRDIPIVGPLYEVLKGVTGDFVCKSANGKQLTETAFKRGWDGFNAMCERAANGLAPFSETNGWRRDIARRTEGYKVFDVNAHDLRYTFATTLYDAGVDVKTAQYLLGHKDLMTTMKIYTKLSEEKKRFSIDKLINHFEGT